MSRRSRKDRSFFDEPTLEVISTAASQAQELALKLPFLLEGQESNLYLKQATDVASAEMKFVIQIVEHLVAIYKKKLDLFRAKIRLLEEAETVFSAAASFDQCAGLANEINELNSKLRRGDLTFLNNTLPNYECEKPESVTTLSRSHTFQTAQETLQNTTGANTTQEASSSNIINVAFIDKTFTQLPQKPQFCSEYGRKMLAETEESARRTRRVFTPANPSESAVKQKLTIPSTIEEKENELAKKVFQSGGSSLDGSFLINGVTYEDIMRPRSATPGRAPPSRPNFDETGLDEFDDVKDVIPEPPTPNVLPPMKIQTLKFDLGPIDKETPRKFTSVHQPPTKPVFTSSYGQKLNRMFFVNETDPWSHPAKFIIFMHSSSIGSIGITILASYCILYKSGPMAKTYKILLMIHLMWSACVEFLYNVCVTPVIFVPFKAGYYNGLFEVLHIPPEFTLMFGILIVCGDIVSILHLFAYRLYSVLPSGNFFRRKWLVNQLFVFFYILTGGYVVALISNAYDTSADRRHIAEEQWGHVPAQIDQWNLIFFSRGLYDHFWSVFFIVLLFTQYFGFSLLATLSAALTFFVIRFITHLQKKDEFRSHTAMSEQTKRMQRTLTWALVLTFGLCIFVPIFVILLGALVFDFLPIEISDMVVFMMSISGTSDTIALLLITRVYRQAVVNMIKNMLQVPPLKWIFCCVKITSSPGLSAPSSVAPAL